MNKDAKERLREYVENDDIYSEYKNGKCDMSDFDKFCIEHCKDIEWLLNENEELQLKKQRYKKVIDKLKKRIDYMFQNEPVNSAEYDFYIEKLEELLKEVQ